MYGCPHEHNSQEKKNCYIWAVADRFYFTRKGFVVHTHIHHRHIHHTFPPIPCNEWKVYELHFGWKTLCAHMWANNEKCKPNASLIQFHMTVFAANAFRTDYIFRRTKKKSPLAILSQQNGKCCLDATPQRQMGGLTVHCGLWHHYCWLDKVWTLFWPISLSTHCIDVRFCLSVCHAMSPD